jgi:peptide/nickel transport system ATP-binding protein
LTPPLLIVRDLTVSYTDNFKEVHAVKSISFSVLPGETLAIVGESGSGKSSTALALMQLLPHNATMKASSIGFYDKKTTKITELIHNPGINRIRGKRMAMIFQNPSSALNPVRKIGAQAEDILTNTLQKEKHAIRSLLPDLFASCGLHDPSLILDSFPHQLSGGQKQRVFIALATAAEPDLLIADEPTTSLDVTVQSKIIELLIRLRKSSGMSMVLISHDLALVSEVADRVLVMRHGEIIESGTCEEIFRNPQKAYTKSLLKCRPPLSGRYAKLPVLNDFESDQDIEIDPESPDLRQSRLDTLFKQKPLLEAINIKVGYENRSGLFSKKRKKTIIESLSLDLFPGETLGLAGESGSGKSTLGKVLAGLIPMEDGRILFEGIQINPALNKTTKVSPVQMVFQDTSSSFNPSLSILEALLEPLKILKKYKSEKARLDAIHAMLDRVQMPVSSLLKFPSEFSGGQIQRLAIARALLAEPRCVVFDESVSSLDVSVQAGILNLINELKQRLRLSCIFISHDLSVIRYMSDRVLIMQNGKIVEKGDADEVFSNPKHEYTQSLIQAIPGIKLLKHK